MADEPPPQPATGPPRSAALTPLTDDASSTQHAQTQDPDPTKKFPRFESEANLWCPTLPIEIWFRILIDLPLVDLWTRARPCCRLFNAIAIQAAHNIIEERINNLCSVHSGNQLSLTTPHFHWGRPTSSSSREPFMVWSSLPDDQHPDIFLTPTREIPCCFSIYLAAELSWTYTVRVIFRLTERGEDGVELWRAEEFGGGWRMWYGSRKGPMKEDVPEDIAVRLQRVCPTQVRLPLSGLVSMLFLGPDQGY